MRDRRNKSKATGDQPPGEHDARDPTPGAEALQQQIGRHFEQEISDEEQSGAKSERRVVQAQGLVHLQLGEADIDAIQKGDEIANDQERQ